MERKIIKDKKGTFKERLLKIAGGNKGIINEKHFTTLIKDQLKMTYNDFTKLQRAAGFGNSKKEDKLLKIDE